MPENRDQENFIINLDQDWQCRWWSKELGVAPDLLKDAIRQAGPLARNVRRHLQAKQPSARKRPPSTRRRPL